MNIKTTASPILNAADAYQKAQSGAWGDLKMARISANFTWGEVFTNCSDTEIHEAPSYAFANAVKQSTTMEQVRAVFGVPIYVHRWYTDAAHNARVGGKEHSYHLTGLATDFDVDGFEGPLGNLKVQRKLSPLLFMQRCGLEFTNGDWTHVDSRGFKARFNG